MTTPISRIQPRTDHRNNDVQEVLDSLQKKLGFISFADDPDWIRKWGYNLARLKNKIGTENFWQRVDVLISDPFHRQHLGSPQYLYRHIKAVQASQIDWGKEWFKIHLLTFGAYADIPAAQYHEDLSARGQRYKLFEDQRTLSDLHMDMYFNQSYLEQYCYNSYAIKEAVEKILVPEGLEMSDHDNLIAIYFGEHNLKTPLLLRKSKNNMVHESWAPYLTPEQAKTLIHNTNIK